MCALQFHQEHSRCNSKGESRSAYRESAAGFERVEKFGKERMHFHHRGTGTDSGLTRSEHGFCSKSCSSSGFYALAALN